MWNDILLAMADGPTFVECSATASKIIEKYNYIVVIETVNDINRFIIIVAGDNVPLLKEIVILWHYYFKQIFIIS